MLLACAPVRQHLMIHGPRCQGCVDTHDMVDTRMACTRKAGAGTSC